MTLKTIAEMTGTTVSTVSKAFKDSGEISNETKTKILNAAKKLGCYEKYYKGTNSKKIIGIILPEPESEIYGIAVGKIEKAFSKENVESLIGISRFNKERARDIYSSMVYRAKVDGIIVFGQLDQINNIDYVPTVLISESKSYNSIGVTVVINLDEAMEQLISMLKKQGYKKIGFIGENLTASRLETFKHAMRNNGLPIYEEHIFVAKDKRFAEAGIEGMLSFIEADTVPEVIITAYDNIAFGAMKVAREKGYRIPDDISFIGINDITTSEYMSASLSSIDTNYEDVAHTAVNILLDKINRDIKKKRTPMLKISAKIKLRESIKAEGKAKP